MQGSLNLTNYSKTVNWKKVLLLGLAFWFCLKPVFIEHNGLCQLILSLPFRVRQLREQQPLELLLEPSPAIASIAEFFLDTQGGCNHTFHPTKGMLITWKPCVSCDALMENGHERRISSG